MADERPDQYDGPGWHLLIPGEVPEGRTAVGPLTFGQWAEHVEELGPDLAFTDIELKTDIPRALVLHGALCFGLRHSDVPPLSKGVLDQLASQLEAIFEAHGLSAPSDGWREFGAA